MSFDSSPMTSGNRTSRQRRRHSAKQNFLGMFHCLMHWSDVSRLWKSNRRVFRRVVAQVAGPNAVTNQESDRIYNVFTTYFLDQALHHEKAHRAHRFDMNVKVARHPDSLIRYNFVARKKDRKRSKFVREMHLENSRDNPYNTYDANLNERGGRGSPTNQSSQERLVASDEIFFHRCRDYLGDRLSGILHDIMKNVKIEFMAVQYTDAKQKAWANWEWVGALYIPRTQSASSSSSFPEPDRIGSDHSASKLQSLKNRMANRKNGGHRLGKGKKGSHVIGEEASTSMRPTSGDLMGSEVIATHERVYPDTRAATEEERRWQGRQSDDVSHGQHVV